MNRDELEERIRLLELRLGTASREPWPEPVSPPDLHPWGESPASQAGGELAPPGQDRPVQT